MLLLVAMYFHSNQLSAIIDLVCSTLGMKVISSYLLSKEDVSNWTFPCNVKQIGCFYFEVILVVQ